MESNKIDLCNLFLNCFNTKDGVILEDSDIEQILKGEMSGFITQKTLSLAVADEIASLAIGKFRDPKLVDLHYYKGLY